MFVCKLFAGNFSRLNVLLICNACETSHTSAVPSTPCLSTKPVALLICETRPPTYHTSTVLSSPLLICNACETSHTSTAASTPLLICKTCRTAYLRNSSPYLSHKHSPPNPPAYLQRPAPHSLTLEAVFSHTMFASGGGCAPPPDPPPAKASQKNLEGGLQASTKLQGAFVFI